MGVQDIGCLKWATPGYGVMRSYTGKCQYYQDTQYIRPSFKMKEFNTTNVYPYGIMEKLVDQLQKMRYALGVPIIITSGYRNAANTHGSGLAADIWVGKKSFIEVAQAAYNAGFRRIEVQKKAGTSYWNLMSVGGHIHVDVYDGSGNTTSGTMYDCPSCDGLPCYPWYSWGVQNSWEATAQPNTFSQLLLNLKNDAGYSSYRGC